MSAIKTFMSIPDEDALSIVKVKKEPKDKKKPKAKPKRASQTKTNGKPKSKVVKKKPQPKTKKTTTPASVRNQKSLVQLQKLLKQQSEIGQKINAIQSILSKKKK